MLFGVGWVGVAPSGPGTGQSESLGVVVATDGSGLHNPGLSGRRRRPAKSVCRVRSTPGDILNAYVEVDENYLTST